jgi:general secretion pathway protein D
VEWFFNNKLGEFKGRGTLDLIPPLAPDPFRPFVPLAGGFSYGLLNSQGQVSVALQALASKTKLNVLSSPSLMVLDNHAAVIKRVQQIPVIGETLASTAADPNVPSVRTSSEYKDAGVILEVTPRINVGGRITLELVQEVSEPGPPEPPTGNPSFQQRQIQSTVTVQSGETLVLGGLIQDNRTTGKGGIPLLSDIPLLGPLFSTTDNLAIRTELIVLLTPKAVRSQEESRAVTEEFRQRLKDLETITPDQYHRREKGL